MNLTSFFASLALVVLGCLPVQAQDAQAQDAFASPGPSLALFKEPYYRCLRNFYVNASMGSNSNSSAQAQDAKTPWLTIANYEVKASSPGAGDCVNVAPGTYLAGNNNLTIGGRSASSEGYVVYRCQTLNGCTITDGARNSGAFNAGFNASSHGYPDYLIFDGFVLNSGSSRSSPNGVGVNCYNNNSTTNGQCHHWWIINNIISYYGQSGVQLNDGEYYYAFHNTIFQVSHHCQFAQGSGISFATLGAISGYKPSADDNFNPKMGIYTAGIHAMASFNVISNVYVGCTVPNGNSDGNGIILDQNGNARGVYSAVTLFSFNVVYNNGGNGIHIFGSNAENAVIANNSCYNSNLDLFNNSTARYCYGDNASRGGNTFINNIAFAVPTLSDVTAFNAAICLCGSGGAAADVAKTNVTFCAENRLPSRFRCNPTYNGNSFSCRTNRCDTNPSWVSVGNVSAGSETSQPTDSNFALLPGSTAIGYLTASTYIPGVTRDAGACDRSFSQCP